MNHFKRSITLMICVVALALMGANCGRNEQPQGNAQVKTFAMNVVVSSVPFWTDTRAAWTAIDEGRADIKTVFGGPTDTNGQRQIEEIEALIAQKVNGIVIAPADSAALVPAIDRAVAQGIPVVTYLVDAPKSKRTAYVASELEDASLKVGKQVLQQGNRRSKVIIVYAEAGNEEQETRRRGFEMLVKQNPNMEIVGVVADKYSESAGAEQLRPLLTKYPDVQYIFGCNSRSAVGAVSALKELGFEKGKVTVTGWDTDADVLNLISEGWVKASAAQNSSFMTQLCFSILKAQSGGWLYPKNRRFEENGVKPLPEKIIVPVQIVTQENVRGYAQR
jgi:ABC-type sugar transport system substrate-binding protein